MVTILFAEDAAAVFLHIEVLLPCLGLPRAEAGTEIAVEELHAVACRGLLGHSAHQLVVLVGADEEGGGEGGKAVLRGVPGHPVQTHFVALAAAVVDIAGDDAHEVAQAIFLQHDQLQRDGGGVGHQGIAACFILLIGVDVGVIPQTHRLDTLGAERLDAADRAGGAAAMQ